jgi:hypothetical protein
VRMSGGLIWLVGLRLNLDDGGKKRKLKRMVVGGIFGCFGG